MKLKMKKDKTLRTLYKTIDYFNEIVIILKSEPSHPSTMNVSRKIFQNSFAIYRNFHTKTSAH